MNCDTLMSLPLLNAPQDIFMGDIAGTLEAPDRFAPCHPDKDPLDPPDPDP